MLFQIYGFVMIHVFGAWALLRQLLKLCTSPARRFNFVKQEGKVFIVTGGLRGIGRSVVERLLNLGAFVIITGRSSAKAASTSLEKLAMISSRFQYVQLELELMCEVAKFCETIRTEQNRIDGIVCNAGALYGSKSRLTTEGFEPQQAVNYFSNVLMIENLRPLLRGNHSRVVLVSSTVQRLGYCNLEDFMLTRSYSPYMGYVQSKLCQIAYARYCGRKFLREGITINAVHPGIVASSLYNSFIGFIGSFVFLSLESGAEAVLHVLLSATMENVSGQYIEHFEVVPPVKKVLDGRFQEKLHNLTTDHLRPWLSTDSTRSDIDNQDLEATDFVRA